MNEFDYFNNSWNTTGLPILHKFVNKLTPEATTQSSYIDPLQNRILNIASCARRQRNRSTSSSFQNYSRISIMTIGYRNIPGYGNGCHTDIDDMCEIFTTSFCAQHDTKDKPIIDHHHTKHHSTNYY